MRKILAFSSLCLFAVFGTALAEGQSLGRLATNAADDLPGFGVLLHWGAILGGFAFIVFGIAKVIAIVRGRAQEGWAYPVTAVMVGTLLIAVPYFAGSSSQTVWKTDHSDSLRKIGVSP